MVREKMMKKRIKYLKKVIFIIFTCIISSYSQESIEWLNYTNGDFIHCIKHKEGHIWVGTNGGLVRIDTSSGETQYYNRSNSGLPSNRIFALEFDSKGNLWIGTSDGLVKFDNTSWEVFNKDNSELHTEYVNEIAIDSTDVIWLGTYNGLYQFDQKEWNVFNTSNSGLRGQF
jgi:ligand-binding sensor domain-containing protein